MTERTSHSSNLSNMYARYTSFTRAGTRRYCSRTAVAVCRPWYAYEKRELARVAGEESVLATRTTRVLWIRTRNISCLRRFVRLGVSYTSSFCMQLLFVSYFVFVGVSYRRRSGCPTSYAHSSNHTLYTPPLSSPFCPLTKAATTLFANNPSFCPHSIFQP